MRLYFPLVQVAAAIGLQESVGVAVEGDHPRLLPMVRQDDIFVTGLLTERLPVDLTDLSPGKTGKLWDLFLSQCPLLSTIKQLFFNKIVLRKGPASLPYVNGPKFFLCCCLESQLTSIESFSANLAPLLQPLWQMCARS